jgi:hypothetical protein
MIAARSTLAAAAQRTEPLTPAGGPAPVADALQALYVSTQPLRACADQVRCQIGVRVSMPYAQPMHTPPRPVLDVSAELPCVYTEVLSFTGLPPAQWRDAATRQTEALLARLDQLIAELGEHRSRLAQQLQRLADETVELVLDAGASRIGAPATRGAGRPGEPAR